MVSYGVSELAICMGFSALEDSCEESSKFECKVFFSFIPYIYHGTHNTTDH